MSREDNYIALDEEAVEEDLDRGVYPLTTTSSDRYTDEMSNAYHIYENIAEHISEFENEVAVLDVGSSSAEALNSLVAELEEETSKDYRPLALDVNHDMMNRCAKNNGSNPIHATAQKMPIASNSVDIVISNQLNLREEDITKVVEEIDRVLDPEGLAVLGDGFKTGSGNYRGTHRGGIDLEN